MAGSPSFYCGKVNQVKLSPLCCGAVGEAGLAAFDDVVYHNKIVEKKPHLLYQNSMVEWVGLVWPYFILK